MYFPHEKTKIWNLPKISVNTLFKHRRTIAKIFNYQFCGNFERKLIEQAAKNSAKISGKPIYIFREIISFLENFRIILQSFSFLQDTISKSLIYEEAHLQIILQSKLTSIEIEQLESLLSESTGFYKLSKSNTNQKISASAK